MNDHKTVKFSNNEADVKNMAVFLAQVIREGVTFFVRENLDGWDVVLTGGY